MNEYNEEIKNKNIMQKMWIILLITFIAYIGIILLSINIFEEGRVLEIIVICSTIIAVCIALYCLKLEVLAGYYECRKCNNRFVPKYISALFAPHIHTTRYLKCPKCNKRSWSKKVMTKK